MVSDEALMLDFQARLTPRRWEELFWRRYRQPLYGFFSPAAWRAGNRAEDLVQETFSWP